MASHTHPRWVGYGKQEYEKTNRRRTHGHAHGETSNFPFSSGEEEEEWVVGKIVNLTLDLFCLRAGLAFFVEGIPTLSC